MFGIGFSELVVIAIVALIFVGPKRLPEVMKQAGKLFVHVRRTANDVKGTFDQVVREAENEVRRDESEQMRQLMSGTKPATTAQAIATGTVTTTPESSAPHGTQVFDPSGGPTLSPQAAPEAAPEVAATTSPSKDEQGT